MTNNFAPVSTHCLKNKLNKLSKRKMLKLLIPYVVLGWLMKRVSSVWEPQPLFNLLTYFWNTSRISVNPRDDGNDLIEIVFFTGEFSNFTMCPTCLQFLSFLPLSDGWAIYLKTAFLSSTVHLSTPSYAQSTSFLSLLYIISHLPGVPLSPFTLSLTLPVGDFVDFCISIT